MGSDQTGLEHRVYADVSHSGVMFAFLLTSDCRPSAMYFFSPILRFSCQAHSILSKAVSYRRRRGGLFVCLSHLVEAQFSGLLVSSTSQQVTLDCHAPSQSRNLLISSRLWMCF